MTRLLPASADWLIPDWPAPANVHAVCTTRPGGASLAPFDSLNLGMHVGDDVASVTQNRQVLQARLAAQPVFLNQVHGTHVVELRPETPHGLSADGVFTRYRALACTIMVADCLPVLLCDADGQQVAAVHAGWRGLAGLDGTGVLEQAVQSFFPRALVNNEPDASKIVAWLGPCIGPEAFEVGPEVKAAFADANPQSEECFTPRSDGKWLADLPGLARQRLRALGVVQVFGNDGSAPWCTVGNPLRFFSHRRDRISGRQAACIWLE